MYSRGMFVIQVTVTKDVGCKGDGRYRDPWRANEGCEGGHRIIACLFALLLDETSSRPLGPLVCPRRRSSRVVTPPSLILMR